MQRRGTFGVFIAAVLLGNAVCAEPIRPTVDFTRDVRPILSQHCFKCHGPDKQAREANLRLDTRAGALAEIDGHSAIVPGKADQSELYARITSTDSATRMPPAETKSKLTPGQIAIIKRWIEDGAEYSTWWSFLPPRRPKIPDVKNKSWPQSPLDAFVLSRLEQAGLHPSKRADKATLIRRVTLDLTGLPPSLAEVDAFLADRSPGAYEKLVDRLLRSPRYGERMATGWLDAARYADTNGYEVDNARSMSPWRDWVVQAFNRNLPFDQFTIEQLAGDLLPDATLQQKIATGFNRNHRLNFEAGTIPEEFRVEYVVDRVDTTATVWLGLTAICARCHDHKYDPIKQKEFYRLFAFFNNVPEVGNGGAKGNAAPVLQVPDAKLSRQLDAIATKLASAEATLTNLERRLAGELARWEQTVAGSQNRVTWTVLAPQELRSTGGATLKKLDDDSILSGGTRPATDVYTFVANTRLKKITAVRLELLPHNSLPGNKVGRHDNGSLVVSEVRLTAAPLAKPQAAGNVALQNASSDFDQTKWESPQAIDGKPATGWAVSPQDDKYHFAVFETTADVVHDKGTRLVFSLEQNYGAGALIGRFRLSITDAPRPVRAKGRIPAPIRTILALASAKRNAQQKTELLEYFKKQAPPKFWVEANRPVEALRKQQQELRAAIPTTMVMQELEKPRDTFVLDRGQYNRPGEKVTAGVPSIFPPLPAGAPNNRLGLAKWLVDPANPLTARVIVNRYWQMYFGRGLVKTTENFGSQGALPTHPQLLDWLATEFIRSGWDVKAMHRLIVTSATYRQSSVIAKNPNSGIRIPKSIDPENRLLARSTRLRLTAEMIRDQVLAVSGLLLERPGGRPIKPYQAQGLWKELSYGGKYTAQVYEQDHGDNLYRRSLYIFWKRTVPPPSMTVFDAPSRETCTVDRPRTNTPLQALALLNDVTYTEAARALAQRILTEGGQTREQQMTFAYRLLLARPPNPRELNVLVDAFNRYLKVYRADPQSALKLVQVGESPRDKSLDVSEHAAATVIGSVLLNLDKFISRE